MTAALPRLAVTVPQFRREPGPALAACLDARRHGFAGAFVFDHLWPLGGDRLRPALEAWTLLAALAAAVGEAGGGLRVGTLVTRAGLRPPPLLARMAATVGDAAGAPAIVGVGRGDRFNRDEDLAFGLPHPAGAGRSAALQAAVAALRGPLAGRPPPEVWVGGNGPAVRALAGRLGDAWNGWALTPAELAAGLADVRRAAAAAGRDPAAVTATWGGQVLVGESGRDAGRRLRRWGAGRPADEVRRTVAGDAAAVLARLAELAAAGASWCVLAPVGGPGAELRARLAAATRLPVRAKSDAPAKP